MADLSLIKFSAEWILKVSNWILSKSEEEKEKLSEINAVLTVDPAELARLYVEPDLQPYNPANSEHDECDEDDGGLFRVPAWRWLDAFLRKPPARRDGRHVTFVVSDAGMGKSSILAMIRMNGEAMAWKGTDFRLLKLGKSTLPEIEGIPHPDRTVLLLDSLDEDPTAFGRVDARLRELLKATSRFRQVVVTVRTQFFPIANEYERDGGRIKIGGFTCKVRYLSLFSERQIDTFLEKLYRGRKARARKARDLVMRMESLRMRPMLLAHVEDLLDREEQGLVPGWSKYRTHEALVEAWLDREERKDGARVVAEDLREGCQLLAIALQSVGARKTAEDDLSRFIESASIPPSIRNVTEFGGRSLLNKNADEDYRFAHYSIQEFLVVNRMAMHPVESAEISRSIRFTDELVAFLSSWTLEAPEWWVADLREADLSGADLSGAFLRGASLQGVNLEGADLTGATLRDADLQGASLSNSSLRNAILVNANLSDANLRGADLRDADGMRSNFQGASLKNADLSKGDFRNADFQGAALRDAHLMGTDLRDADIQDADLEEADLRDANLQRASVEGSRFFGADLQGADLRSASTEGANLEEADLFGASLRGTAHDL